MIEDRQRARGRVAVALDVVRHFFRRQSELFLHGFDDAQIGLMNEQQIDLRHDPEVVGDVELRVEPEPDVRAGVGAVVARTEGVRLVVVADAAFVRAVAYHQSEDDPIATAAGTFMLTSRGSFTRMDRMEPKP